jgi:Flp pilus assembly pilin Flp
MISIRGGRKRGSRGNARSTSGTRCRGVKSIWQQVGHTAEAFRNDESGSHGVEYTAALAIFVLVCVGPLRDLFDAVRAKIIALTGSM